MRRVWPEYAQPPHDHARVTKQQSRAAVAVRVSVRLGLRKRAELLEQLRRAFGRGPWLQAGKYVAAVMSDLPNRTGGRSRAMRGIVTGTGAAAAEPGRVGHDGGGQSMRMPIQTTVTRYACGATSRPLPALTCLALVDFFSEPDREFRVGNAIRGVGHCARRQPRVYLRPTCFGCSTELPLVGAA